MRLAASTLGLRHFRFGPIERLGRCFKLHEAPDDAAGGRHRRGGGNGLTVATSQPAAVRVSPAAEARAAPAAERIEVLDALRGFALFGILLANIRYWSGWIFMDAAERAGTGAAGSAELIDRLHGVLIDGKFYSLFSLLFGIGFALQLARLEARGADGVRIYRRRLLVLLAIGLVHLVLIWDGDILTLYALLGLTLPFFRRWTDRTLIAVAAALTLLPIPGVYLVAVSGVPGDLGLYALGDRIGAALGGTPGEEVAWLQRSDWGAYWSWVLGGAPYRPGALIESWRIPKVLAIMMLGLWAGRRLIQGRLLEDRTLLLRILMVGGLVGMSSQLLWVASGLEGRGDPESLLLSAVAYAFGVVPLAAAYAAGFVLLWPRARRGMAMLVAPGRMALTNYLMHSLLGIAIFYGIGLGLIGTLSPLRFYGIAVAIFAGQTLLSHLWLARFEQGPMERLWRLGTYGRRR